jgi:hypothetical protein
MRALLRWTTAIAGSVAVYAASWVVFRYLVGLDNGTALAIAGVPLAAALAVLAWWAAREPTTPTFPALESTTRRRPVAAARRPLGTPGSSLAATCGGAPSTSAAARMAGGH